MSDEKLEMVSEPHVLTAEYQDGQLKIIEVMPYENQTESHILSNELGKDQAEELEEVKYMQVMSGNKGLVQLDLPYLTLVRCGDGEDSYQLMANEEPSSTEDNDDSTVTCVLQQSSDTEDLDPNQGSYVMMHDEENPIVILQSPSKAKPAEKCETEKTISPAEILERAKALQRARANMKPVQPKPQRGRKRKSDLPPPHELLSSPNFKLFLYSCKLCNFKCNAIKEMTAHKAAEHGRSWRGARAALQCARCPFRAAAHAQLVKHLGERHRTTKTILLDTEEVEAADVLVCGACGFESSSRSDFRKHIEDVHDVTTL